MELLIALAALGVIVSVAIPQFSKIREGQALKSAVTDILSSIDKARGETLSSLNSSEYGVHFESGKIVVFKGAVYSPGVSDNETIGLISPISITNVNLGGLSDISGDIYFNRLSGAPSVFGAVTLSGYSSSKVVNISATGVASVD